MVLCVFGDGRKHIKISLMYMRPPKVSPEITHKYKDIFSETWIRRSTCDSRSEGHSSRQISDGFRPVFFDDAGSRRNYVMHLALCNAASGPEIWFPGQISAGFDQESLKIGPPAGKRPAEEMILMLSRLECGRNPARKPDFRTGSSIAQHRVPSLFVPLWRLADGA